MSQLTANTIKGRSQTTTFTDGLHVSSGVGTFASDLTVGGNLNVTGDLSYDEVTGRNINVTGILTAVNLNVTGITTAGQLQAPNGVNAVGVITATAYKGSGADLTGLPAGFSWIEGNLF